MQGMAYYTSVSTTRLVCVYVVWGARRAGNIMQLYFHMGVPLCGSSGLLPEPGYTGVN
jgi:hypothetical protein